MWNIPKLVTIIFSIIYRIQYGIMVYIFSIIYEFRKNILINICTTPRIIKARLIGDRILWLLFLSVSLSVCLGLCLGLCLGASEATFYKKMPSLWKQVRAVGEDAFTFYCNSSNKSTDTMYYIDTYEKPLICLTLWLGLTIFFRLHAPTFILAL